MAHMFRVDYICNHANGMVETGRVLVVAESHEQAQDIICLQSNLPRSRTRFTDSSKIKPAIYQIEYSPPHHVNRKASVRSARDTDLAPVQRYHFTVTASNVNGQSEQQVMRKVGEELCARGLQTRLKHNIQMSIECSTATGNGVHGPAHPLERIEMFRPSTKTQGGRTQGK